MFYRIVILCALICAAGSSARAEERFVAQLNGANAGTPSAGTGSALFVLDEAATLITFSVEYAGLGSPEAGAHVHRPAGGIALILSEGSSKAGFWQFPSSTDLDFLRAGQLYVNIHTLAYTSGEIRGYLVPEQTPVRVTTWGRILALYR